MRSFRYGPTRAWVREVEAVLGTGSRVRLGSRVAKRSVGPDLLQMFVGSEGTLGIATEVTVRLAPVPAVRHGVIVPVPRGAALGPLVARLSRIPDSGLSAVEYLDRGSAAALAERLKARWPRDSSLLLLEVEAGDPDEAERRLSRLRRTLGEMGAGDGFTVFEDADELWTLRGASGDVLLERYGLHVREDVAVPLDRVDALVAELERIARRDRAIEAVLPDRGARRGRGRAPRGREAGMRPRRDPESREALPARDSASATTFSVAFGTGSRPSSDGVTQRRSVPVPAPGLPRWRPAKACSSTVK